MDEEFEQLGGQTAYNAYDKSERYYERAFLDVLLAP
jgi:hypothetical protein